MPEARDLPLFRWGEDLRRRRARRAGRFRAGALAAGAVAALAVTSTLIWPPRRPVLVWNGSASSPRGLYRVTVAGEVGVGDMVVAWPPDAARRLAARRGYIPSNVPLVKNVAAARGDTVCAMGEVLYVNGRFVALRRREDISRRALPWWRGCRKLESGELFLLMPGSGESFDGRYFGTITGNHVVGRGRLIWAL